MYVQAQNFENPRFSYLLIKKTDIGHEVAYGRCGRNLDFDVRVSEKGKNWHCDAPIYERCPENTD
ncbi:hypothetical protein M7I_3472 [Glarea lozoyensis 74030]|uniref:Uncharacterized protein n=1 Tax=Glarea lozoyensis (strain ATCC 74030 / MF5533) TaxID=1104152 RepID=H0ELK8_GLAL7|nr:hypothetical protein M7I_3472 [Glarea lozoyensis 74030]